MKKAFIISGLLLFSLASFAQKSWYVGGIAGYNQSKSDATDNPTMINWSFGPEIGVFFNENWSAGLVLGASGQSTKDDEGDISKKSNFAPNFYGRRWWSAGERLGIFAGLDVSFGSGSTTNYLPTENTVDNSTFGMNVNAGVAYALAQRWTLLMKFAALGYSSEKSGDETTTNFGLVGDGNITSDQFIFVGLYWTFCQ